jgi:LmbE family N-acetylglucosaminyl deacetylase
LADSIVDFHRLTGGQNLFVLATAPGDETLCCGALIAEASARGRPPFIAILTDGSTRPLPGTDPAPAATAALHERRTRAAVAELGVPHDWFLMLGLHDGTAPLAGRKFDAVVDAVAMIMWRRDCNLLVATAPSSRPDDRASHAVATAVVTRSGVGLLLYRAEGWAPGVILHSDRASARRRAALAIQAPVRPHEEAYLRPSSLSGGS